MKIEEFRTRDFADTPASGPHLEAGDIFYRKFMASLPWERCECTGASIYPNVWRYCYTPDRVVNGNSFKGPNMQMYNRDLEWMVMERSIAFSVDEMHAETRAVAERIEASRAERIKDHLEAVIARETAKIGKEIDSQIATILNTTVNFPEKPLIAGQPDR